MPTLDGIDVSKWQDKINWPMVAAAGPKFTFVRMSRTLTKDGFGKANLRNARAAGLLVGGYHFMTNSASGDDQASTFLAATELKTGDLLPVIDIESEFTSTASKKQYVARCERWISIVSAAIGGKQPFIYTRKDILSSLGNPASFRSCPLWLARYSNSPPAIPTGFSDYVIWQYSDSGSVSGISGKVDLNSLNVSFARLKSHYTI